MYGNEQVGLDAARLLHPDMQRHEVVIVARQVGPHIRLRVDQLLQPARDAKDNVFLACAAASDGPWILAAMAWIQGDQYGPVPTARFRSDGWRSCRRPGL